MAPAWSLPSNFFSLATAFPDKLLAIISLENDYSSSIIEDHFRYLQEKYKCMCASIIIMMKFMIIMKNYDAFS